MSGGEGGPPPGGSAPPAIEIRVPAVCESLALTREAARRVAAAAGFDEVAADEIAAAVEEAVANVVQHAYRGEPGHEVLLRFRRETRSLAIEVEHRGDPPGDLPSGSDLDPLDLDRLAKERRKGGLGIHLMRRLMDTVEHRRPAPGVGCWLLVRNRPPGADSAVADPAVADPSAP